MTAVNKKPTKWAMCNATKSALGQDLSTAMMLPIPLIFSWFSDAINLTCIVTSEVYYTMKSNPRKKTEKIKGIR